MRKLFEFSRLITLVIAMGIFMTFISCQKDEEKKAPVAAIDASPTSGTLPLLVNFTDKTTNTPTSWQWNFGDGSTSTLKNPSHTYNTVGTFSVQLTVSNDTGSDSEIKSDYVTATNGDNSPVAAFIGNPTNGAKPLTVNFTNQSDNLPISYQWNFGDGGTSTLENPTHIYTAAGTYSVQLTVSNGSGFDNEIKSNYITVTSEVSSPVAAFTGNPTSGALPLVVNFTDQSTNNPTSWQWNFGDGNTSALQNPNHTYNEVGTYSVQLTVTSNSGSDTKIMNDYISVIIIGPETVSDVDGNIYQIREIGQQSWLTDNLKVTHYRNGDEIPNITGDTPWSGLSTGAYCWYSNDISWKDSYGALYNWFAVVDSRELCPAGWHIPSNSEWITLTNHLLGTNVAGGKMKMTRTEPNAHPRWDSPNTGATNESGFSGLPGGHRDSYGTSSQIGRYGDFWSSTTESPANAYVRTLSYSTGGVGEGSYDKNDGYSVRCVKD